MDESRPRRTRDVETNPRRYYEAGSKIKYLALVNDCDAGADAGAEWSHVAIASASAAAAADDGSDASSSSADAATDATDVDADHAKACEDWTGNLDGAEPWNDHRDVVLTWDDWCSYTLKSEGCAACENDKVTYYCPASCAERCEGFECAEDTAASQTRASNCRAYPYMSDVYRDAFHDGCSLFEKAGSTEDACAKACDARATCDEDLCVNSCKNACAYMACDADAWCERGCASDDPTYAETSDLFKVPTAENGAQCDVKATEAPVAAPADATDKPTPTLAPTPTPGTYDCSEDFNFVQGLEYETRTIRDADGEASYGGDSVGEAIKYCSSKCDDDAACSGYFFQIYDDASEVCGFYVDDLAKGVKKQYGYASGSQICSKAVRCGDWYKKEGQLGSDVETLGLSYTQYDVARFSLAEALKQADADDDVAFVVASETEYRFYKVEDDSVQATAEIDASHADGYDTFVKKTTKETWAPVADARMATVSDAGCACANKKDAATSAPAPAPTAAPAASVAAASAAAFVCTADYDFVQGASYHKVYPNADSVEGKAEACEQECASDATCAGFFLDADAGACGLYAESMDEKTYKKTSASSDSRVCVASKAAATTSADEAEPVALASTVTTASSSKVEAASKGGADARKAENLVRAYEGQASKYEIGTDGSGLWTGSTEITEDGTETEEVTFELETIAELKELRLYRNPDDAYLERFPRKISVYAEDVAEEVNVAGSVRRRLDDGSSKTLLAEVELTKDDIPAAYPDYYAVDLVQYARRLSGNTGAKDVTLEFEGNFAGKIYDDADSSAIELAAVDFVGVDAATPTAAPTSMKKGFECEASKDGVEDVAASSEMRLTEADGSVVYADASSEDEAKAYCEDECRKYNVAGAECTGFAYSKTSESEKCSFYTSDLENKATVSETTDAEASCLCSIEKDEASGASVSDSTTAAAAAAADAAATAAPTASPKRTATYDCDSTVNHVEGVTYSTTSLTDAGSAANPVYASENADAKAVAYCKQACGVDDQCTGFFYNRETSGEEVCGFVRSEFREGEKTAYAHESGCVCEKQDEANVLYLYKGELSSADAVVAGTDAADDVTLEEANEKMLEDEEILYFTKTETAYTYYKAADEGAKYSTASVEENHAFDSRYKTYVSPTAVEEWQPLAEVSTKIYPVSAKGVASKAVADASILESTDVNAEEVGFTSFALLPGVDATKADSDSYFAAASCLFTTRRVWGAIRRRRRGAAAEKRRGETPPPRQRRPALDSRAAAGDTPPPGTAPRRLGKTQVQGVLRDGGRGRHLPGQGARLGD